MTSALSKVRQYVTTTIPLRNINDRQETEAAAKHQQTSMVSYEKENQRFRFGVLCSFLITYYHYKEEGENH